MTLVFALDENDYLQYQLYTASKNTWVNAQRKRTWLILSCSFLFTGLLFYLNGSMAMAIPFAVSGLILLFIFPLLNKESIFEHYKRQVNEIYENNFGVELRLVMSDELIEIVDDATKTQIHLKQIDGVIETGNYLYVSLKKGGHIIIPKSKINGLETVKNEFRSICGKLSAAYTEDLNWKW